MDNLRLRRSVGIVTTSEHVDFFKSNTRESLLLKMKTADIVELLKEFDGQQKISDICDKIGSVDEKQLQNLAHFLHKNHILIQHDATYPHDLLENSLRLINLLEDYCFSTSEVLEKIAELRKKKVMIIGLGTVGSYVALQLAQFGVLNFVFVDKDHVEESNLHRQYYFEDQLGQPKSEALKNELQRVDDAINIDVISQFLTPSFFCDNQIPKDIDLIINCADEPNVDTTSKIISEYAMAHNIPHIVGGGYNLHLTLIGQTIIPYKTACFECFNLFLKKLNDASLKNVKKLHREDRKLGSFAPLSGIASNLASLDAFKLLIGRFDQLQQANKRIEFNVKTNQFSVVEVPQSKECKWCSNATIN